jgi:hypothetical protein
MSDKQLSPGKFSRADIRTRLKSIPEQVIKMRVEGILKS